MPPPHVLLDASDSGCRISCRPQRIWPSPTDLVPSLTDPTMATGSMPPLLHDVKRPWDAGCPLLGLDEDDERRQAHRVSLKRGAATAGGDKCREFGTREAVSLKRVLGLNFYRCLFLPVYFTRPFLSKTKISPAKFCRLIFPEFSSRLAAMFVVF